MTAKIDKLAIIGLGYVGLPLAVEFGKTRQTIGFDINETRIADLRKGVDKTLEVTPQDFLQSEGLELTSDPADLENVNTFIVTVPTPIDDARRPDLTALKNATELVGNHLTLGGLVIFESTVYPGCTEEVCVPILEACSGLKYNKGFFCGYSPERVNPGDKVNTLRNVKKIISGSSEYAEGKAKQLYDSVIDAGTWMASSIRVAEAAKVIENTQRDLNIAFVNELSIIFERLGIDTSEVLEAASTKWNFVPYKPGMVGGHCIGVDPYYLTHKAEELGYSPQVILAGRRINDNMARYVARNVIRMMLNNGIDVSKSTVGILGVTFKENCPDVRNSKVLDLCRELKKWSVKVVLVDPLADPHDVHSLFGQYCGTIDQELNRVDSLIVAVGHHEYRQIPLKTLRGFCRTDKPVLGDVKALYDYSVAKRLGFSVFRL